MLNEYVAFADAHPEFFVDPPGAAFEILRDEVDIHKAEAKAAHRFGIPLEQSRVGIVYQDPFIQNSS